MTNHGQRSRGDGRAARRLAGDAIGGGIITTTLIIIIMVTMIASTVTVRAAPGEPTARAAPAQAPGDLRETADGRVVYGEQVFASREAFIASDLFRRLGLRCATPEPAIPGSPCAPGHGGSGADCSLSRTDPLDIYDPTVVTYRIPVVVHVIRASNGSTGHLSEARVRSQIDVLNEDFLALPGSFGENGTDVQIEFHLATVDPDGNPTSGITYSNNDQWFSDNGSYWDALAWDPHRYLNIYTNNTFYLGYVPDLPQGGIVGQAEDRVVCYYRAFGRDSGYPPYHLGRTATHEIGHYLGLLHTFSGGCGTSSCYVTADLVCDTERESGPHYGCPGSSTCGDPDPIHNYLNYTDDICMQEFTPEQARRMRCTLEHYRPDLYEIVVQCPGDVDGSGAVGFDDLIQLLAAWGPCAGCPEDVDGNGSVEFADLVILLAAWGPCP